LGKFAAETTATSVGDISTSKSAETPEIKRLKVVGPK
jgi:hypothetical protein